MNPLFEEELQVLNIGLPAFAEAIRTAGGTAAQVEWAPPGQGDPQVARRLAGLINHPAVEAANQQAFAAYQSAQPVLEGIGVAGDEPHRDVQAEHERREAGAEEHELRVDAAQGAELHEHDGGRVDDARDDEEPELHVPQLLRQSDATHRGGGR